VRLLKVLLVVGVVLYGLSGVVQVRPGELAVVRRFGRVLAHKPEPGLWVGLPWGMDRVDRVAVDRVQSVVVGFREDDGSEAMPPGQLLTGDHNLVNVQAALYYKVRPDSIEDYVAQGDRVEAVLERAAEAVLGEWVAGRTVDDVLLNGKTELRAVLTARVPEVVIDHGLGVQVLDARVAFIQPPDEVKDAFDDVAREQTKMTTRRHQAEQQVEEKWRQAQSDKYRLEQSAAAYAHGQEVMAQSDARRFLDRLAQYRQGVRQNPQYLQQIWQEERGKLFARLKENQQIDLLDHHLGSDGLDLLTAPPLPRK
jgi:membrane protease subunit HflK